MKQLSFLIIFFLIAGCATKPSPVPEKKKQTQASSSKAQKKSKQAKTSKQSTSSHTRLAKTTPKKSFTAKKRALQPKNEKKAKTQKSQEIKKEALKVKTIEKKVPKKEDVAKEMVEKEVAKKLIKTSEESKTVSLTTQTSNPLLTDENRHIFFVGKKVRPLQKRITKVFHISQAKSTYLKEFKELFSQEAQRQSTFITITTLSDLFKEKPLYKTLNSIENLATKKTFFVVFYNHEKNLLKLLETKLLNGLKNGLLFMPLTNKTTIDKENSVYKLVKALQSDSITFKQMHEEICDHNTKECSTHVLGNNYLLY